VLNKTKADTLDGHCATAAASTGQRCAVRDVFPVRHSGGA
jgi:hypothetical protein